MPRREEVWLSEMRDASRQTHFYAANVDLATFSADQMRMDATVRQLEIVGEASTNVALTTKTAHPEMDWSGAARARNRLIHAYFNVESPALWRAARDDMPILAAQLDAILNPPQKEETDGPKN